jgi:oligopeptide/dipeptide ABC transporter ATP-binding protein
MTDLLSAQDAQYRYPRGALAIAGVSLTVEPGEAVGIVGESGSGKTTLGRLLVGALVPDGGAVTVKGRPWSMVARHYESSRSVQMIFQDPLGSLNPSLTATEAVAEVLRVWSRLNRRSAREQARSILNDVGLSADSVTRPPSKLSGGQCQRVGIARALAANPSVLVADEPTSSLDVSVQAQILELLQRLRENYGLALVLISLDLALVRHMTDRALVMYRGRVVEDGPTGALLTDPLHPYTQLLVASIPGSTASLREATNEVNADRGCVFAAHCPEMTSICLERQPLLSTVGSRRAACVLFDPPRPTTTQGGVDGAK